MLADGPARSGRGREERGRGQEHGEGASGKDPFAEDSRSLARGEDQSRRRDREEEPDLLIQLEERVHPVVDVEPLRDEDQEEGRGHEAQGEPVFRPIRQPPHRQEEEEYSGGAENIGGDEREQSQEPNGKGTAHEPHYRRK